MLRTRRANIAAEWQCFAGRHRIFAVEAVQQLGPNIFSFEMATGERLWYIVGCYLAPNNTLTIESVVAMLRERPRGTKLLVVGDFNVKLSEPEGDQRATRGRPEGDQRATRGRPEGD